ncbi:MAG: hypothetical protein MZV49_00135 [Rhodopseudomonas palustris]|nr:hypothetical protein [Rhodopseudomonas palustris]
MAGFSGQITVISSRRPGISGLHVTAIPLTAPEKGIETELGNLAGIVSAVAALQVQEAIKVLTGAGRPLREPFAFSRFAERRRRDYFSEMNRPARFVLARPRKREIRKGNDQRRPRRLLLLFPGLSELVELYRELDREIARFKRAVALDCPEFCRTCCTAAENKSKFGFRMPPREPSSVGPGEGILPAKDRRQRGE